MDARVIDISKHNGEIDFKRVKAAGIYGVVIRAGYGRTISQKDPKFEEYYAAAKAAGLRVGAYWYSYAESAYEAIAESAVFLEAVKGKKFELPLYYDIEEKKQLEKGEKACSAMADAFCSQLERDGYFAGIYSYDSFFGTNLSAEVQKKYTCWVARVENVQPKQAKKYDMWQYTWKGDIDGIKGAADVSRIYRDFEGVIKSAGLNGYGKKAKYGVTARIAGLDKGNADSIAESCQKMGMSVVIAES